MRFGLSLAIKAPNRWSRSIGEVLGEVLEDVVLAEEIGFDSIVVTEHHFSPDDWCPSPLVVLGAIAARTRRVRLGTAILVLPFQHPVRLAEDVAVLDVLSNGRMVLGIGMGYRPEEFAGFGVPVEQRLGRFLEGLTILQRCWSDDDVSFDGVYFKLKNARVRPRPVQKGGPPLWVGANSESAIRRAADLGLTYYFGNASPLGVLRSRTLVYERELRRAGRDPRGIERPLMRELYVAETAQRAWDDVGEHIVYAYREEFVGLGFGVVVEDENGRPHVVTDPNDPIFEPRRLARDRMIIGSPDDCINEIRRYEQALGATEILFRIHHPGLSSEKIRTSLRLFASDVMPAFTSS